MIIRNYNPKDLEQVAAILEQETAKPPYNEPFEAGDATETINNWAKFATMLVAEEDGKIVGISAGERVKWMGAWRLWVLALYTKVQGKGIGTQLLNELITRFNGQVTRVELATHKDAKAMEFYKKQGFKHAGLIILEKHL